MVLFVGTKRQAREIIKAAAESCGMPFVTERWIGGLLTYFTIDEPISSQLDRLDVLIKGQLKNQLTGISYIDLRFGDKVYYKQ
jgi:small subunit ribosomal protein S2